MLSISIPGIANIILSVLLNFIQFDVLYTEMWLPKALKKVNIDLVNSESQALNLFFDQNGYGSKLILANLGSGLIFIGVYALSCVILMALDPIKSISPV